MPRYALRVEYDGAAFHGWQYQDGLPSVQGELERALGFLNGGALRIAAAGRTDTGVHAIGQVAHVDMHRDWTPFRLLQATNAHLRGWPVAVTAVAVVPESWHARFSAMARAYTYRILCRSAPPVLSRGQVWHVPKQLNVSAMQEAATYLIGHHDFTTFRASQCQAASPMKTLDRLEVEAFRVGLNLEVRLHLEARSFLHNQVRSIAGSLERVGRGAWAPAQMQAALAARDRAACGPVAPPDGLCLTHVSYPQVLFENSSVDPKYPLTPRAL